jgi:D-amino-acid oxidase
MSRAMHRRSLLGAGLAGLPLAGLGACATIPAAPGGPVTTAETRPRLAPVLARPDRLFDLTVCLRPFRAAGPRLDAEQVGDALVVHNYGHGGSGWSLSWGSAEVAVGKAMAASPQAIAVVGCGALGLTSAITAQRAGARVTIYAKELLPQSRSARATGLFTPDSRVALANAAPPGFADLWERMARTSLKAYRNYLGLPGDPVEWIDYYGLSDNAPPQTPPQPQPQRPPQPQPPPQRLEFVHYRHLLQDVLPGNERLADAASPFEAPGVDRYSQLMFNIADYGHTLLTDFLLAGGQIRHREFHGPGEFGELDEKVVINCTGYGARALWSDESIVPIRGQIGWLPPQREVNYGLDYKFVTMAPRRDGIVVQLYRGGMQGYGDDREVPDRTESEQAVATVAEAMARLRL